MEEHVMFDFVHPRRRSLTALMAILCCSLVGGVSLAEAQSNALLQPEDVVRRPEYGRFLVSEKYTYQLLDAALERSVERYGPYRAEPLLTETSVARLRKEAVKGDLVNVLVGPPVSDDVFPIDIPLDKGLMGYRVAFIRANEQGRVDQVRDIEDLRQLRVGHGAQWFDTPILEHNNLNVVKAMELEPLFQMLEHGRFDLLPRGITELLPEYDHYVKGSPTLAIDQHLLIHYPQAKYVYVSPSAPRLAQRIRYGLEEMQKDGSFDRLFDRYFSRPIADLRLGQRTLIELDNPSLPAWAKIPTMQWH
jgi:hypothetical protein